jgi:hypothetical protein
LRRGKRPWETGQVRLERLFSGPAARPDLIGQNPALPGNPHGNGLLG